MLLKCKLKFKSANGVSNFNLNWMNGRDNNKDDDDGMRWAEIFADVFIWYQFYSFFLWLDFDLWIRIYYILEEKMFACMWLFLSGQWFQINILFACLFDVQKVVYSLLVEALL